MRAGALALGALILVGARATGTDDLFTRSRAMYASLKSYEDTGTVDAEYGLAKAPAHDHHTFTTAYLAPRRYFFDFRKSGNADRFVIWSDDQAFHTWWKATGAVTDYPKGTGTNAFLMADPTTAGSAMKIPELIFGQAGLQGTLAHAADLVAEGTDVVGGRTCQRLVGTARDVYGATGREVNVRTLTVWIDPETLLIRRIAEVPKDLPPGQVSRTVTTFEPHANPTLDPNRFRFTPPPPRG